MTPSVKSVKLVMDGKEHDYPHCRLDLEIDADKNTCMVWRVYSLHPGKRQGMKPVLEASVHDKVTRVDLMRSIERAPFCVLPCEEISVGSSFEKGTLVLELEPKGREKMERFIRRLGAEAK